MAYIVSYVSLHPSYLKLPKDSDKAYACIIVKGNKEYDINQGTFMVKLNLAQSPCQNIPLCQDNYGVIVHGRLVEFERGLTITIRANSAKVYPVPNRDFQHPSLLAIAGTIAKTSASSFSGKVTWFDISCAGNLTSSPRSSQSQPISGILRNSDRKSISTSRNGSTSSGSKKVTFDDILSPKHTPFGSDNPSRTVRKSYEDDEISGTVRRVDTTNSDYSAPATVYPPRATRSATVPLPPAPPAPPSRLRARTGNAPLSGIQVDPKARDFSIHGDRSIDRRFVPRPLLGPVDSFQLSQSNQAGGKIEFQTFNNRPSTSALPNHQAPEPFIPSKIIRAARSISNMKSKASFKREAHDGTAGRSEDLLWADIDSVQVDLSVGTEFDGRSTPANGFINPTLQATGSRYPTLRDRRRGIYGNPVPSVSGASVIEQYDLVKTGSGTSRTTLGSNQAQMKGFHRRRDAVYFGEKPEIERPKMASTSSGPPLDRTRTTSTTPSEPTLLFTIRCFLPKGDHPFRNFDFSVGQPLAVTGELQGFVGEGPNRIASIIVSEIGPYSLGTDNAERLNNCCGVSCTEQDPLATARPLAALDPVKVDNMRDLIRKARERDDYLKSKGSDIKPTSSLDGAARRPALSKLRKESSGRNIKSKVTQLFTRSSSKSSIPTPPESPEKTATAPRSANPSEGSSSEHARAGVATPWSINPSRTGMREAGLRQELPRLRTAEAQALARQSFLPTLSQFSPLSMESPPPHMERILAKTGFSPMTMTPQSNELTRPVEARSPPLKIVPKPDRDLPSHPPAKKLTRSSNLTQRRKIGGLQLITDHPFVFPQRTTATEVAVGPAGSEASTPTTPTPATCKTSWKTSSPIPHHHHHHHQQQQQQQQHQQELSLPPILQTWTISQKKRAKQVINALNSHLPLSPLKKSVSQPRLKVHPSSPSPPLPMQGIPKSHSAPKILPHRGEQRVSDKVVAAWSLAPHEKMWMIKEEVAGDDDDDEKEKDDESASSWYDSYSDSVSDYADDEKEEGNSSESMLA